MIDTAVRPRRDVAAAEEMVLLWLDEALREMGYQVRLRRSRLRAQGDQAAAGLS